MATYGKGDEIAVTINGTITSAGSVHDSCHKIEDGNGKFHYVYLGSADRGSGCDIRLVKKGESFVSGQAYMDADGDVYIKYSTGWIDRFGKRCSDSYPARPLARLAAATVTEEQLEELIRKFIVSNITGRISSMSAHALSRHLVDSGVKVAE